MRLAGCVRIANPTMDALVGFVWALPFALALWLAWRSRASERTTWCVVAVCLFGALLDKSLDLQSWAHSALQGLTHKLDPQWHFRGPNQWIRIVLLGAAFTGFLGVVLWILRRDQRMSPAKICALSGLVVLAAFLCTRHLPDLKPVYKAGLDGWLEAGAFMLVLGGLCWGAMRLRGR